MSITAQQVCDASKRQIATRRQGGLADHAWLTGAETFSISPKFQNLFGTGSSAWTTMNSL
ncbi:hypothetical protein PWG15_32965 (plasmid) [Ensifer adhaerens]|uniref:hypothetical protein n=1 Tax=Ensifer adhaerens TaxID=106592 RepID=UPI0023A94817|nr:hypothetical protein [Ensifer adhaerens]WDZ81738.1 hypothetical protein PWG15_32965 [Ensifer adhaerens]